MRVLLDQNVPKKAKKFLAGHEVSTAAEMGWSELEDTELLKAAESKGFQVIVTADQNIPFQQNLSKHGISLVILMTNNWNLIKGRPDRLLTAVNAAKTIRFQKVQF